MILLLEYGNDRCRFGAIGAKTARWLKTTAAGDQRPLDRALTDFGFRKKPPSAVVAIVADRSAGAAHASWSTVRTAVAAANTLAFSWNAPAVCIRSSGREDDRQLAEMARRSVRRAKRGEWIRAIYSGEPNISKAKKII